VIEVLPEATLASILICCLLIVGPGIHEIGLFVFFRCKHHREDDVASLRIVREAQKRAPLRLILHLESVNLVFILDTRSPNYRQSFAAQEKGRSRIVFDELMLHLCNRH